MSFWRSWILVLLDTALIYILFVRYLLICVRTPEPTYILIFSTHLSYSISPQKMMLNLQHGFLLSLFLLLSLIPLFTNALAAAGKYNTPPLLLLFHIPSSPLFPLPPSPFSALENRPPDIYPPSTSTSRNHLHRSQPAILYHHNASCEA